MHAKAPEAIAKYIAKGCNASKLTVPELEAVARVELATTLKGKDKGDKGGNVRCSNPRRRKCHGIRAHALKLVHGSSGKDVGSRRLANQGL